MATSVRSSLIGATRVFSGSCANIWGYRDLGSDAAMADMPRLDFEIIDQPSIPPAGAGEIALIAGPPAIGDAIRSANGFRALRLASAFTEVEAGSREN